MEESFKIGDLVLYKNNQLIAFNKPAGIPVQPDLTHDRALLNLAEIYAKSSIYLVHRLDRPVSGVLLFAKTKTALQTLSDDFRQGQVKKTYLAVVQQAPPKPEDTITHYLRKDSKAKRAVVSAQEDREAQKATLYYKVLAHSDRYCLLEVQPLTGRFHQIRAQLAAMGCPVKGDVKYGARRKNPDRSIHLHAWKLEFNHPVDHTPVVLTAPLPEENLWQAFAGAV